MNKNIITGILFLSAVTGILALEPQPVPPERDREIMIDEFIVREMPLDQILAKLEKASVEADEKKVGIKIVNLTQEPLRSSPLTMSLYKKTSVRDIIDMIAVTIGLRIKSDGNTIEVRKSDRFIKAVKPAK